MAFSVAGTGVAGLLLAVRRPLAVLAWSAMAFAFTLLTVLGVVLVVAPDSRLMGAYETLSGGQMLSFALRVLGVFLLVNLGAAAVINSAVYRAVLRPDERRFAYLRLGRDELRVAGVLALFSVAGALNLVLLVMLPGFFKLFGLLASIWFWTRISLAGPMAFATGRIQLKAAWARTAGRFWNLLGAYLISWVLAFIVLLVAGLLSQVVALAMGLTVEIAVPDAATQSAGAVGGAAIVNLVIGSLMAGLFYAIMAAPTAVAWRAFTPTVDISETFA